MSMEVEKVAFQVNGLRRRVDEARSKRQERAAETDRLTDRYREVEKLAAPPVDQDSPQARQIRALENRLDKAMIKYNEAQSIRKTYEQILKRLHEERVGFDNQLQAVEGQVKAREGDLEELRLMFHDATHAKEVARSDLARYQQQVDDERLTRARELQEMRTLIQTKQDMTTRADKRDRSGHAAEDDEDRAQGYVGRAQEERRLEENAEKVTTYEEAFRKIKEATGVTDVNEVIQKFLTQEDTLKSLQAMTKEAQARIDALSEEKVAAKARVEEIKYSATGAAGSHRIVDEFETQLAEATAKCDRNKQKYERAAKVLINVKAGVEHLNDKLEAVKSEIPTVALSDETIVDVLGVCDHKLTRLLDAIRDSADMSDGEDDDKAAAAQKGLYGLGPGVEPSAYNVRIKLPNSDDRAGDADNNLDDDDDDDKVLDRNEIKRRAALNLEKAVKKPKKPTGKSGRTPAKPSNSAAENKDASNTAGAVSKPQQPGIQ
jgi:chromosome segregation ATPase